MAQQVPASIETEQALLGSLLLYPETAELVYEEGLEPEDFFADKNRRIYREMQELYQEGKPIDVTSVITRLTDKQEINNVGGADYFSYLTDVAISATNSEYYISILKEKTLLRELIRFTEDIKIKAMEEQYNAMDVLDEAERKVSLISNRRRTSDFVTSKKAFEDAIRNLNLLAQSRGMTGVASGYEYLDRITNGFQKGDLIILAARPAVGKTALALNMATNAVYNNNTVALFSLEMPYLSLAERILSAKSGVDSYKIRTGQNLTNDDWARIDSTRSALEKTHLFIDDASSIKVNDITAKCRKLQNEQGLDLVIIDYLQLINARRENSDNREQDVSEISRSLKQMARELNVPVIALSQLNRSVEQREREPMLSDLRESGAIEQDADIVMFIHPVKKKDDDENADDDIVDRKLIIAKHRNGAIGDVWLAFKKSTNTFITKQYRNDEYE